jgi:ubiquinone/menaquinone biosynthesis C-methylase UbiE
VGKFRAWGFEMNEPETYIHGREPIEQERLAGLNRMTNRAFVEFMSVRPAMHVLEVGSGLGLLAADIASAASGALVVGLERTPVQIAAAVTHANVRYVRGDAHSLSIRRYRRRPI